ncbi:MAG: transposase [Dehalococcoidia bacterium]
MSDPVGYFITFTCYGERLHGDPRGSAERLRVRPKQTVELEADLCRSGRERSTLVNPEFLLNDASRIVVADAIVNVGEHRGWRVHALNVRTNHVHVVVSGEATPESMMMTFKAWATRRLRESRMCGPRDKIWTRHGSTRYLWDEQDIVDASTYVLEGQGQDLGGLRTTTDS